MLDSTANEQGTYSKKLHISWEKLFEDTIALAEALKNQGPWQGIIAVTRGGLVPAGLLSQAMNIKMIDTLCISSYDYQDQGDLVVLKSPEGIGKGKGWLVVDDLVDTGKTFVRAREIFPEAHFACIYAKPLGAEKSDTYIEEVSQETWVCFPWEIED